jgi:hypothetical protein
MFLVAKQNLNPSYLRIWCTKDHQKHIRIEKVIAPKVEEVKNSKEQTPKHYKASFRSPKKFFVYCFVTIKVQR